MNITRIISLALTTACLAVLSACGQGGNTPAQNASDTAPAQEAKVLRIASNAEFAPFEYTGDNGKIMGFDIDLMNAMAKAGNFKVSYRHQPWDGIFASLSSGDSDVLLSAITITPERAQSMDFTNPYFEIQQVILTPEKSAVKTIDDLKKIKKIGVITGQTGDLAISKLLGATSDKISRFESLTLAIKALQNNGVEAVVSDSAVIQTYVKNNPTDKFTIIAAPDFPKEEYGMAVRKDDKATLEMLNSALQKVRENGEYGRIYNQYFGIK